MTVSEAIEKFKSWRAFKVSEGTVKGYDLVLRQFCLFVRDCDIEQVKIEDVMTWFGLMKKLNWDGNSFVPKAMALRKFFEFYIKQGYKVIDPWLIPVPNKKYKLPRVADEEQYKKLFEIIPAETNDPRHIRNKAIISLLWDTGARNGEILSLDADEVDTVQMKALIKTEKNKGSRPIREIFWTKETNDHLIRWINKRDALKIKMTFKDPEALFISAVSNQAGKRFTIKGVGEMLRRYANRAKIPYMNAHSFRHHMGHDIVEQGGSSADVMNILGHATLASSSVYVMMTDKELEKRYNHFKRAGDKSESMARIEIVGKPEMAGLRQN